MLRGAKDVQYRERETFNRIMDAHLLHDFCLAIDGGAHVGTWTELFHKRFFEVIAIEPSPAFADLKHNAMDWGNTRIINAALTDHPCRVESYAGKRQTLTARKVRKSFTGPIEGITIDSLNLDRCSLIKLDLEGYELLALMGALDTLKRCKPFIIMEMAGHGDDQEAEKLLFDFGYSRVFEYGVDVGFKASE